MRAKEKISTALQASIFTAEQAEHLTQELYDAVAHELAEELRAHDGVEPDDYRRAQAWREGYSEGLQEGADLIDPEVSRAGGCGCACHQVDTSPCDDCSEVSDGV